MLEEKEKKKKWDIKNIKVLAIRICMLWQKFYQGAAFGENQLQYGYVQKNKEENRIQYESRGS